MDRPTPKKSFDFHPDRAQSLLKKRNKDTKDTKNTLEVLGGHQVGRLKLVLTIFVLSAPLYAQTKLPPAASTKVDYTKDIRPLLAQNCYGCHGPEVQQSGLRLDLRQNALRG